MTEIIKDNPYLSFFALCVLSQMVFRICNRILRHWTLRKHGYPPPHCDADGDFKEEKDPDDETPQTNPQ